MLWAARPHGMMKSLRNTKNEKRFFASTRPWGTVRKSEKGYGTGV